jgi:hypothetical protein
MAAMARQVEEADLRAMKAEAALAQQATALMQARRAMDLRLSKLDAFVEEAERVQATCSARTSRR